MPATIITRPPKGARCVITGTTVGPMLNTGQFVRNQHVYVALKQITPLLRKRGWRSPEDVSEMNEMIGHLNEQVTELREKADAYDKIVHALAGHVPEPEPRVVERVRKVPRPPSLEEVAAFIRNNPNHPAVRTARKPASDPEEAYDRLYSDVDERKREVFTAKRRGADDPKLYGLVDNRVDADKAGRSAGAPPANKQPDELRIEDAPHDRISKRETSEGEHDVTQVLTMPQSEVLAYARKHPEAAKALIEAEERRVQKARDGGSPARLRHKMIEALREVAEDRSGQ